MRYEAVIGLEVHCQLATQSKIFCACPTQYGAAPNTNTCPVCLGLPGALPVLNAEAVRLAVQAALAFGCRVEPLSIFSRKNYFYPDLPKGYQITQFDRPYALGGAVSFGLNGREYEIPLIRIHMEEDAGKSVHGGLSGSDSLVDLNRAGTPLIEIVSTPSLHSADEAVAYLKALHAVVTSLGVCDGNMEQGNFRCDANVSIRPEGSQTLGTRVELKNLNSFRFLGKAIQYELDRQVEAVEHGELIRQQTRLWDQERNRTVVMRDKEDAEDYRYFPEPDLQPLRLSPAWLEEQQRLLPELPRARARRYQHTLGLSEYDADVLTAQVELSRFFEAVLATGATPKLAANWVMGDVLGVLNRENRTLSSLQLTPASLGKLLILLEKGSLTGKLAKQVFEILLVEGGDPEQVMEQRGLKPMSDTGQLESLIDALLKAHPKEVEQLRSGKEKVFGFFVGQLMKQTKGQADPAVLNTVLRQKLSVG